MVDVERDIYLKNNFTAPLFITKITSFDSDLTITKFNETSIPILRRTQVFSIKVTKRMGP